MTKRGLVVLLVAAWLVAQGALAQAPPQMPTPGPEQKRLGYFAGEWTGEADMKESPFGPAGKMTSTDRNEWFPGGFFLVLHSEMKGAMGDGKGLALMGYNAEEKVYTYYAINNLGMAESAKGTVAGNTWTWTSEAKMGGKMIKGRFIIKELSPTSYNFTWEISPDGQTWSTVMQGKTTKVK